MYVIFTPLQTFPPSKQCAHLTLVKRLSSLSGESLLSFSIVSSVYTLMLRIANSAKREMRAPKTLSLCHLA
jgi:hypothetical protein